MKDGNRSLLNFLESLDKKYVLDFVKYNFFKPSHYSDYDITRDSKEKIILEGHVLYDISRVLAAYRNKGKSGALEMHEAIQDGNSLANVCKDGKRIDYTYNIFESINKLLESVNKLIAEN